MADTRPVKLVRGWYDKMTKDKVNSVKQAVDEFFLNYPSNHKKVRMVHNPNEYCAFMVVPEGVDLPNGYVIDTDKVANIPYSNWVAYILHVIDRDNLQIYNNHPYEETQ